MWFGELWTYVFGLGLLIDGFSKASVEIYKGFTGFSGFGVWSGVVVP